MTSEISHTTQASRDARPVSGPITSLDDPRAIQILSTEHWSVLTARSLAYNEAFIRGGMFLTFLSMSFVALALLAQAMAFGTDFLVVAAIVLAFDLIIGLTTFGRIAGANYDDLRAMHGMARIRRGYIQAAPILLPYFTSATHDDADSVIEGYHTPPGMFGSVIYGLTTSAGMIALIVSLVAGVLVAVVGLLAGVSAGGAMWLGAGGAVLTLVVIIATTGRSILRQQAALDARFPAPPTAASTEAVSAEAASAGD
jgi:hypothetical protein